MQDDDVVFCATMTDACETPAAQDCMTVEVAPAIDIIIEPLWQADCSPFTATVSILTDQSLYSSASWQFSNGASSTALQKGSATFMDPGFYDLEISLRNQFGCVYTETFNDIIQVYTDPYAAWNATPLSTDLQNTNVQFINYSQGDSLTYSWDFGVGGGGDISTLMNPSFAFPTNAGDEYTVTLGVTDDNGCYSEVQGLIDINDLFHVWVPNSFTPNNDELNDVIFVSGSDISADNFEWIIFDRWGQVVFRSTDPLIPWKGEINGGAHFAQDGVYSYILKIQAETHIEEMTITGHITLVR
jgi:gliding motility-associated-like protein